MHINLERIILLVIFVNNFKYTVMKSYLKTVQTDTNTNVDSNTGEVLDVMINKQKIVIDTREPFFMIYASFLHSLTESNNLSDVKLLAALIQRYADGKSFQMGSFINSVIAQEANISVTSIPNSLRRLVDKKLLIKLGRGGYMINPEHAFYGGTSARLAALKVVLELECPNC